MKPSYKSIACILGLAAISPVSLHGRDKCGSNDRCAPRNSDARTTEVRNARSQSTGKKDIVDTAVAAGSFKTLAAALTAAGLVDALKGEGPFTVFAPTDEAFAKLPPGTVENLLKPENKAKLTEILTYHVVAGEIPLSKALEVGQGTTLQGSKVNIRFDEGRVKIGDSNLVSADIQTRNGVIHVIDTVLIPAPSEKSVPAPRNSRNLSDLTVGELTELLKVINIQIETE